MTNTVATIPERRQHPEIREVFVEACEVLAPIVASNARVKTVSAFGMARMLVDYFPTLTPEQAHIVIATAEKLYYYKRLQAVLHKKS